MLLEAAIAELPRGSKIRLGSHTNKTTMTLLKDDHDFVDGLLRKGSFNLRTSHWLDHRSSILTDVSAGDFPSHRYGLGTVENGDGDEDYKLQIPLPAICIPSEFSNGPSSSAAQPQLALTDKLVTMATWLNVKMSEKSCDSSPTIGSPVSSVSSPKERKPLLSSSCGHSPSPSITTVGSEDCFNGEDSSPPRLSDSLFGKSPLLYSPCIATPYYFSPLSYTSSHNLSGTSPRSSMQSDTSHAPFELANPKAYKLSFVNSPIITKSKPTDPQEAFDNALYSVTPLFEAANSLQAIGGGNGSDSSLSFASPVMEVLDEGHSIITLNNGSMTNFINRGHPSMQRSFSASRATIGDGLHQKPVPRKYHSEQLPGESKQSKLGNAALMEKSTICKALDELFPLKQPNRFKQAANGAHNQQKYEAAFAGLEASERPAQEVEMQGRGENGYAYSPVASAFVFSPRKASQNSHYLRPASSLSPAARGQHRGSHIGHVQEGSLKGGFSSNSEQEVAGLNEGTPVSTRASWGSPKISSVLLRFAEAQERVYNSAPAPQHLPSSAPSCLPICSFLGRTFLCRSKFPMANENELHK